MPIASGEIWSELSGALEDLPVEKINNLLRGFDEIEERWNSRLVVGGPLAEYYVNGLRDVALEVRLANGDI